MTKTFKVPFATQGDRTSIPNEVQADGAVSYTQGYGYDYERDQVSDPAAKDIEREKMNGIFHDITEAIGEVQNYGFPKWTEEGKPYPIRAVVYHKNKVWQSKVENNEVEPVDDTQWAELKADLTAGDINVYNKTESDKRYQPLGNYQAAGYSYSKDESDTNFQPKGNYALQGSSYSKQDSDGRFQPLGNYQAAGYSYSKDESDGRYQPKGSYQPAGNYAPAGDYATNTALTNGLNQKLNTSGVVQSTGSSTTQVMSQKAVTDLANTKQAAGNYLIRQRVDELPSRGTECAFDGTGNVGWVKGISVGSGDTGQIYVDSRANLYTRFLDNSGAIAEQSIVSVPIGATIIWNTSAPIPNNFWPNEGRSFSASDYPELAKIFPNLKLPDDRGYAIRAADNGRGKDPGRTVGTYQEDQIQNITGSFGAPTTEGGSSSSGAFSHTVSSGSRAAGAGGNSIKFDFDAGRSVRAGDETRMKNVSKILITRVN